MISKLELIICEVLLIEVQVVVIHGQIVVLTKVHILAKIRILTEVHIVLAQIDVVQIILPKMLVDGRAGKIVEIVFLQRVALDDRMLSHLGRAADHGVRTKILGIELVRVIQIHLVSQVLMLNSATKVVIRTEVCRTAAATCHVGSRSASASMNRSASTRMPAATTTASTRSATCEDRCRAQGRDAEADKCRSHKYAFHGPFLRKSF